MQKTRHVTDNPAQARSTSTREGHPVELKSESWSSSGEWAGSKPAPQATQPLATSSIYANPYVRDYY